MPLDRVDIVVPVYRNRATLRDLVQQMLAAASDAGIAVRFVFVNDACPENSTDVLEGFDPARITILHQPVNTGQQAAIRRGLAVCGDHPVIVMDADLQDPPEAVPKLLATLDAGSFDAVFAVRKGAYQHWARRFSGQAFRVVIRRLVHLPKGAGGYVAISQSLVFRLNQSRNPQFYLAGLIGCHADRIGTVNTERQARRVGQSAYTGAMRWATGLANIRCILHERGSHAANKRRTRRT
jgi:polyisoprenyl-phosphate glycosyltransferase